MVLINISEIIQEQNDSKQFSALKDKSTTLKLTANLNDWCSAIDSVMLVLASFVDFSKAFDKVDYLTVICIFITNGSFSTSEKYVNDATLSRVIATSEAKRMRDTLNP